MLIMKKRVTVRQFKYRGTTVTVDALMPELTGEIVNEMGVLGLYGRDSTWKAIKFDKSSTRAYQSFFRDRLTVIRDKLKAVSYETTMVMEGKRQAFTSTSIGRSWRRDVKYYRGELISSLRYSKKTYLRLRPYESRPSGVLFRYTGNVNKPLRYYGNTRVGWVHSEPNQILRLHEARLSTRMFEAVRPMTSERHIGVEIECGIKVTRERLAFLLRAFAGYVMVKSDGSVNVSNREAVELNVCAPLSKYKEILRGVTDVLNSQEVSARINKSCGLHVHLDVREWRNDFNALSDKYARLISVQGILYSMQPASRQNNTYCQKSKSRSIVRGASRYQGINAQSIWKYTTIETRIGAGTTDYTKIANWCDLLIGIMYSTNSVPKRALTKVTSLFKYYNNVPSTLLTYVNSRVRQFADSTVEEDVEVA